VLAINLCSLVARSHVVKLLTLLLLFFSLLFNHFAFELQPSNKIKVINILIFCFISQFESCRAEISSTGALNKLDFQIATTERAFLRLRGGCLQHEQGQGFAELRDRRLHFDVAHSAVPEH